MHYPPSSVLANVIVQGQTLEEAAALAATLGRWFDSTPLDKVRVLGPAAAPIARLKRIYRFHFVLKAERRDALGRTCARCSPTRRACLFLAATLLWTWTRSI